MIAQAPPLETPPVDWLALAPELSLFVAALVIVLGRSLVRHDPRVRDASVLTAVAGIVVAGTFTAVQWRIVETDGPYQALAGMVAVDGFAVFVRSVILAATLLTVLVSIRYLDRNRLEGPEYLALVLLSATGMGVMASAHDLIAVFLALEVLSIALYVLAAFDRRRLESQEAGLKYFVLGAFSSAIFLYGIALVYGATGTTSFTGIATFLGEETLLDSGVLLGGVALLLVGLGFKVAAAPFHSWAPDVYQGAPSPVTAFMASATKVAGFAALLRVLVSLDVYRTDWRPAIWALAAASLVVGSFAAIVQTDVKRLLAYSSIAHAGYVLIGVQVATERGSAAALFYLLVYAFMAVGAFAIVGLRTRRDGSGTAIEGYRGLGARDPAIAALLTMFLVAQAGVPLTGGFTSKLAVFEAAIDAGQYWLALLGMLAAVVGAFAYLRVVITMYAPEGDDEVPTGPRVSVDAATGAALFVAVVAVLATGLLPGGFLEFARDATLLLAG